MPKVDPKVAKLRAELGKRQRQIEVLRAQLREHERLRAKTYRVLGTVERDLSDVVRRVRGRSR